jgi:hypothetical protein
MGVLREISLIAWDAIPIMCQIVWGFVRHPSPSICSLKKGFAGLGTSKLVEGKDSARFCLYYMQIEGAIGLHEQVEFDHAKAFPFQANLPDELTCSLSQT